MSVSWQNGVDFFFRAPQVHAAELENFLFIYCAALHEQMSVHGNLVVARAGRVEFSRSRANDFCEPGFNMRVDVFELGILGGKAAGLDFTLDLVPDPRGFEQVLQQEENSDLCKHARMRAGALQVFCIELNVQINGDAEFPEERCCVAPVLLPSQSRPLTTDRSRHD